MGNWPSDPRGQPRAARRNDITSRDAFVIVIVAVAAGRRGVGRRFRARQGRSQCRLCDPGEMTSQRPVRGAGRVPVLRDEWREPLRALRDPIGRDAGRTRVDRDRSRQWRKQTWLGRFVSTYSWRAYALPVLVVLTALVIYQTVTGTSAPKLSASQPIQGPPDIGAVGTAIIDAPPRGLATFDADLPG